MQKSRIYALLGANTIVLYGLVLFLLKDATPEQWTVVGIAMVLMVIVPVMMINRLMDTLTSSLKERSAELKETKQELETVKAKMAQVTTLDELTGCYNRRHFMELLTQHRGMCERGTYLFTVAISQVDQFSDIVDSHGLARGHEVLQLFSRIVKAALREVDVIARLEADKFGLILSGCGEGDALNIINRISELIGQIQVSEDDDIQITASGGITSFHGTESVDELMDHAEQALDFAVEQGRDRVAGYNYVPPEPEEAEDG
ncbi:MAG TPA: GGDEF domain-containing protein [Pseudomonadales bacterium]|nr:GGDEF domain-containing protein [Pseudomonadales bacterium]